MTEARTPCAPFAHPSLADGGKMPYLNFLRSRTKMLTDFLAHLNATHHLNVEPGDLTEPFSMNEVPVHPGDYAVAPDGAAAIWRSARFDGKSWHAVGFVVGRDWVWCGLRAPAQLVADEPLDVWASRTLQDMRSKTVQAIDGLRVDAQSAAESDDRRGDDIDQAGANVDMETRHRAAEVLTGRLREIHDAIARLRRGEYGICEASGDEIARARLRANPLARYTVEHLHRLEMTRRGYATAR
jgi:DnaK suppressor protein